MMPDFRIIQLTDFHIGQENEFPLGVDLRNNLIQVLGEIERLNPNLLVLTGDFCYKEPLPELYEWIYHQIQKSGIPYEVIAGNHDDKAMMTKGLIGENLANEEDEYYFSDKILNYYVLYLDSGAGFLSERQMEWIRSEIENAKGCPLIVFMHHPPLLSGVLHMDESHFLRNGREFIQILKDYPGTVQIFCGHYHVDRVVSEENIIVYITPSLFMQIFPYSQEFAIDHYRVGYRVIDFVEERIQQEVRYLPGNRF